MIFNRVYSLFLKIYGSILYSPLIFSVLNKEAQKLYNKIYPNKHIKTFANSCLESLKKDGIVQFHLEDLLSKEESEELLKYATSKLENAVTQKMLDEHMKKCEELDENQKTKDYLLRFPYSKQNNIFPSLDFKDPFIQTILDERFLTIINNRFNFLLKLMNTNYWYAGATPGSSRVLSQNWHRDWDDPYLLKIFIYLNDITEEDGPFQYVKGSHDTGKFGKTYRRFPITGRYLDEEKLKAKFPEENFISCTGKKGSFIICDTSGFHRGGYVKKQGHFRYMFYAVFTSMLGNKAFRIRKLVRNFDNSKQDDNLSLEAKFALK